MDGIERILHRYAVPIAVDRWFPSKKGPKKGNSHWLTRDATSREPWARRKSAKQRAFEDATMSAAKPRQICKAGSPFKDEGGDLVLRTCDGVDFLIHRILLVLTSTVFQDMFSFTASRLLYIRRRSTRSWHIGHTDSRHRRERPVATPPDELV